MTINYCRVEKSGMRLNFMASQGGTHQYTWRIITDSYDEPIQILDEAATVSSPEEPIPLPWATLTQDPGAYAQSFDIQPEDDSGLVWLCTVTFSPLPPGKVPQMADLNPLLWGVVYELEFRNRVIQIHEGYNVEAHTAGNPIVRPANTFGPFCNTAGYPFEFGADIDESELVLRAKKNYATLADIYAVHMTYKRTYNDAEFFGRPEGFARFLSISQGPQQNYRGTTYYPATIRVALDDTRRSRVTFDNVGRFELVTQADGSALWSAIFDNDGNPVTDPVPLEYDGTRDSSRHTPLPVNFEPYESADYSGLGI